MGRYFPIFLKPYLMPCSEVSNGVVTINIKKGLQGNGTLWLFEESLPFLPPSPIYGLPPSRYLAHLSTPSKGNGISWTFEDSLLPLSQGNVIPCQGNGISWLCQMSLSNGIPLANQHIGEKNEEVETLETSCNPKKEIYKLYRRNSRIQQTSQFSNTPKIVNNRQAW
ncbi:hypothetical protein ACLOJK_035058 [Asimina triloba]